MEGLAAIQLEIIVGWPRKVAMKVVIDGQHLEISNVEPTGFSDEEDIQRGESSFRYFQGFCLSIGELSLAEVAKTVMELVWGESWRYKIQI